MKRKSLRTILTLTLAVAALLAITIPIAQAAPSNANLADAYKAYYGELKAVVDKYGIGATPDPNNHDFDAVYEKWNDKMSSGVYAGQGIYYAELVRFGDSALPQLLYIYDSGYGPSRYVCYLHVYSFSNSAKECYSDIIGGDDGSNDFSIVTDRNGVIYLHKDSVYYDADSGEAADRSETYYTVRNGQWVEVPGSGIVVASKRALGYSPDTVSGVLAELQTSQPAPKPPVTSLDATPSAWSLNVNGGALRKTDMYSIDGNNYLKVRDIAALLDGTTKQFNITVEGRNVNMITGKAYDARGDEMKPNPEAVKAKTSASTFSFALNSKPVELTAYMIAGSNYVKLRDVLRLFDVYVGYNTSQREFYIDTAKAYTDN